MCKMFKAVYPIEKRGGVSNSKNCCIVYFLKVIPVTGDRGIVLVLRGAFRPRKEAAVIGVKRNLVTTPAKPGSYQPLVARRSITYAGNRAAKKPCQPVKNAGLLRPGGNYIFFSASGTILAPSVGCAG